MPGGQEVDDDRWPQPPSSLADRLRAVPDAKGAWVDDTSFDIASNAARANSVALQVPSMVVA